MTLRLENGKRYLNGRGDELGPMDERAEGVFLDQYGRLYHPDGRQWDHAPGSTGNVAKEAPCSHPWATSDVGINSGRPFCQACGLDWQIVFEQTRTANGEFQQATEVKR